MDRTIATLAIVLSVLAVPVVGPEEAFATRSLPHAAADSTECESPRRLTVSRLNSPAYRLYRTAQIHGDAPLAAELHRTWSRERERAALCAAAPAVGAISPGNSRPESDGLRWLPSSLELRYSSTYAVNQNDGSVWPGRGISATLQPGALLRWGPLEAAAAPEVNYQQNLEYPTVISSYVDHTGDRYESEFRLPWYERIDLPQRFGTEPYWTLRPGQSYVKLEAGGVHGGFTTENLWRGPATRYPLIFSNTAAGFPQLFVGTEEPLDVGVGELRAELRWGWLTESDYFNRDPDDNVRILNTWSLTFRPDFAPGLFVGANQVYETTLPPDGLPASEYFESMQLPFGQGGAATRGNGLGSLFFRWVQPESGFEVYGEWAKDDFNANLKDFLMEPDHGQAYMLGLQKAWDTGGGYTRFTAELVHLQASITSIAKGSSRPTVVFYTHGSARQGHTQRGQMLGSYTGPGSFGQYLAVEIFREWGQGRLYVERVRRFDEAFFRQFADRTGFEGHDLELSLGGELAVSSREIPWLDGPAAPDRLSVEVRGSRRWNRHLYGVVGIASDNSEPLRENNLYLSVRSTWRP